jgi:GH24 family phage-related lysozyme (muramidase)
MTCSKTITVEDIPQPKVVACKALDGPTDLTTGQSGAYTASATDESLVAGYTFKVNGQTVTANGNMINYTFNTAGTYTISATVTPKAGVTDGGSANCVKTVTVKDIPKLYVACSALNSDKATYKVGETAQLSAVADFPDRVQAYTWIGASGAAATSTRVIAAGDNVISVTIIPKSGILAGQNMTCTKTLKGVEDVKLYVACSALNSDKATYKVGETANFTVSADFPDRVASYTWTGANGNGTTATRVITAGDNKVSVTITPKAGILPAQVTCEKTVTGETIVKTPIYRCDAVDAVVNKDRKVSVTVHATAENGATVTDYTYNYGDGTVTTKTVNTDEHTYATGGQKTIVVTVKFNVSGEVKSVTCEKSIDCEHPPVMCDVKGKENLPKDSPDCKVDVEHCTVKGKENLPKDSADCKETPKTEMCTVKGKETLPKNSPDCKDVLSVVTEIPNTGAGSVVGLFAGVTVAGAFLHRAFTARRFGRQ